jgi:prepilin-type N-terminal cleavage/methylation domain-containing protein
MLQNTNKNIDNSTNGFTLVELLIAIAVFGIISVISVQGLYDIVSFRAKQQTIEDSSDSLRIITRQISKSVTEADRITIENTGTTLKTENEIECHTFTYESGNILHKISKSIEPTEDDPGTPCTPPTPGLTDAITSDDYTNIDNFSLSPVGSNVQVVTLEITGQYTNSLGDHPINYSTTITRRK